MKNEPLSPAAIDKAIKEQARRFRKLMEKNGFCFPHELTDCKQRDARIYRRLNYHVTKDLGFKLSTSTLRAPLVAMFQTARDAMALDTASPTWATIEIVQGPYKPFLEILRSSLPCGAFLRQGDFDCLFMNLASKRDLWYLYICGDDITPADTAARGAVAIAIDEFLDMCDAQQNQWSMEFQRLFGRLVAASASPSVGVADTDTDEYLAELFKEVGVEEEFLEESFENLCLENDEDAMDLD